MPLYICQNSQSKQAQGNLSGRAVTSGNTALIRRNKIFNHVHLWYAAAAETVCAPLNDVHLARPHMWQPLCQFLRPRKAQAGWDNHQQGPLVLQQQRMMSTHCELA